jgi:DNA-directed RNA polymerase specialized sigma subunit
MAASISNTIQKDENLETYALVWLDTSVNSSQENIEAQQQLQTSINHLLTFEDDHECLQYIYSVPKDDRIVLIVSGRSGRTIVPKIAQLRQISSIYVYCMDKKANEQWSQQFSKVSVFQIIFTLFLRFDSKQNSNVCFVLGERCDGSIR